MARGWIPVVIPEEIYNTAKEYYQENKEELKLRHGVRSLTGFLYYCIREYLKANGVI